MFRFGSQWWSDNQWNNRIFSLSQYLISMSVLCVKPHSGWPVWSLHHACAQPTINMLNIMIKGWTDLYCRNITYFHNVDQTYSCFRRGCDVHIHRWGLLRIYIGKTTIMIMLMTMLDLCLWINRCQWIEVQIWTTIMIQILPYTPSPSPHTPWQ